MPRKANPPPNVVGTEADFEALLPEDQRLAELILRGEKRERAWSMSTPKRTATGVAACVCVSRKIKNAEFARAFSWLKSHAAEAVKLDAALYWERMAELADFDPLVLEGLCNGKIKMGDLSPAERRAIVAWKEKPVAGGEVHREVRAISQLDVLKACQAGLDIATHKVDASDAVGKLAELLAAEGAENPQAVARALADAEDET